MISSIPLLRHGYPPIYVPSTERVAYFDSINKVSPHISERFSHGLPLTPLYRRIKGTLNHLRNASSEVCGQALIKLEVFSKFESEM